MSATRSQIVDAARSWVGVPFLHQGRNRHGVDCVGLAVVVMSELGLGSYDFTGYARRPESRDFLQHMLAGGGIRIPLDAARPGDVIAFRDSITPCHLAIVSEKSAVLHLIHAHALRRRVVEEPYAHEWLNKRLAAFQMPGLI